MDAETSPARAILRNPITMVNRSPVIAAYISSDDDDELLHSLPTTNLLRPTRPKRNFESISVADTSFFGVVSSPPPSLKMANELYSPGNMDSFQAIAMSSIPDPHDPLYYSQETIDRYGVIIQLKKTELVDLRRLKVECDDKLLNLQLSSRNQYAHYLNRRDELQTEVQTAIQSNHKSKTVNTEMLSSVALGSTEILRLESQKNEIFDTKDVYDQKIVRLQAQLSEIKESLKCVSCEENALMLQKLAELDVMSTQCNRLKTDKENAHQSLEAIRRNSGSLLKIVEERKRELKSVQICNADAKKAIQAEEAQSSNMQAELTCLEENEQQEHSRSKELDHECQDCENKVAAGRDEIEEQRRQAVMYLDQQRNEHDQKLVESHNEHQLLIKQKKDELKELIVVSEEAEQSHTEILTRISEATQKMQELLECEAEQLKREKNRCLNEELLKAECDSAHHAVEEALIYEKDLCDKVDSLKAICEEQHSELLSAIQWLEFEDSELAKAKSKHERLNEKLEMFGSVLKERGNCLISQDATQSQNIEKLQMKYRRLQDELTAAKQAQKETRLRCIEVQKAREVEARAQAKELHDAECREFQELHQVRLRLAAELRTLDSAADIASSASSRAKRPLVR